MLFLFVTKIWPNTSTTSIFQVSTYLMELDLYLPLAQAYKATKQNNLWNFK